MSVHAFMQCCDAIGKTKGPGADCGKLDIAYIMLLDVSTGGKLFKGHLRGIQKQLLDYLLRHSIGDLFEQDITPSDVSLCNHFAVCALLARFYGKDFQAELQDQHNMSAAQQKSQHLPEERLFGVRMFGQALFYMGRVSNISAGSL